MCDMTLVPTGSLILNHDTISPNICSDSSVCLFDLFITSRVFGHGAQEDKDILYGLLELDKKLQKLP